MCFPGPFFFWARRLICPAGWCWPQTWTISSLWKSWMKVHIRLANESHQLSTSNGWKVPAYENQVLSSDLGKFHQACVNYFPPCYHKITDKNSWKRALFWLPVWGTGHHGQTSIEAMPCGSCNTLSTVRKRKGGCWCFAWFLLYIQSWMPAKGTVPPTPTASLLTLTNSL